MGMFDWVECKIKCPICGNTITGFQTKDLDRTLRHVEPTEPKLKKWYSFCDNCGLSVEFEKGVMYDEMKNKVICPWCDTEVVRCDVCKRNIRSATKNRYACIKDFGHVCSRCMRMCSLGNEKKIYLKNHV